MPEQNLDRMADRLNHPPEGDDHDEDCDKFGCFYCERNYDCPEDHECQCWEAIEPDEYEDYKEREREWQRKGF